MYTVYKITNTVNDKFYIGVHKTQNPTDSYFGSGKAIREAIIKYGKENFVKDVLFVTESKEEAYNKEKELTIDFNKNSNYNMKLGGVGGFTKEVSLRGYQNSLAKLSKETLSTLGKTSYSKSLANLDHQSNGRKGGLANKGICKSEEHKEKLREAWRIKKLRASSSIGGTVCS